MTPRPVVQWKDPTPMPYDPHPNYVRQDFPSKPEFQRKKIPKIYKIYINSQDRIRGTINNGFYQINLPVSIKDNKCLLYIEYFGFNNEVSTTDLDRLNYNIHISELSNPYSYHTATKQPTNIILVNQGRTYAISPTTDTLGIPLINKKMFEGNTINIFFTSKTMSDALLSSQNWSMVLTLWEEESGV